MKLELKHLAPYLPYGLKGMQETNNLIWWLYKESNICRAEDNYHSISINDFLIYELKPILRPLSDLTNEIAEDFYYNGEEPFDSFSIKDFTIKYYYKNSNSWREIQIDKGLKNINKCFKHHLDVYGLIEKGLAIDINSLNK